MKKTKLNGVPQVKKKRNSIKADRTGEFMLLQIDLKSKLGNASVGIKPFESEVELDDIEVEEGPRLKIKSQKKRDEKLEVLCNDSSLFKQEVEEVAKSRSNSSKIKLGKKRLRRSRTYRSRNKLVNSSIVADAVLNAQRRSSAAGSLILATLLFTVLLLLLWGIGIKILGDVKVAPIVVYTENVKDDEKILKEKVEITVNKLPPVPPQSPRSVKVKSSSQASVSEQLSLFINNSIIPEAPSKTILESADWSDSLRARKEETWSNEEDFVLSAETIAQINASDWKGAKDGNGKGVLGSGGHDGPTFYGKNVVGKNILFVLDVSGSMQGTKLRQMKKELAILVSQLEEDISFGFVMFPHARFPLEGLAKASKSSKKNADEYIESIEARGGTPMFHALHYSFDKVVEKHKVDTIYLMSDGDPDDAAKKQFNSDKKVNIHCVAVGGDSEILKNVAKKNNGDYWMVQ